MPDARQWLDLAIGHRTAQRMADADAALTLARDLAPDDPQIAFLLAQLRYERGLPAADLFARAQGLDPANRDACRNRALALASEGQVAQAQRVLAGAQSPDWLDGLRVLASLRWVAGDVAGFDAGWATAARANPMQATLWLGWFGALAQIRDWPRAAAVIDEAQRHLGETHAMLSARVLMAGETGALDACAALLDRLAGQDDDFLRLARMRLALRRGDPARARDVALAMVNGLGGGGARQAWSYLATAWRMLDDPLADWLEGDPAFVRGHDVGLTATDLDELAQVLRALHSASAPYAEQSVRAGTQTDRSVLLRHEPIFTRVRAALLEGVRAHVAGLPVHDPRHPLLSQPRQAQLISGSWSVRLGPGGYNVAHTHPLGWLSSAFYVSLPDQGQEQAGHFHWGAPPAELGLDLAPRGMIAPQRGQLLLFPSYVWHGTVPIAAGERLNIAFDVVPKT